MSAHYRALLDLRGTFQYPSRPFSSPLESSEGEIVALFPVTDEHAILIYRTSVHLLYLPSLHTLWTLLVADPLLGATLAPDQSLLALAFPGETLLWDAGSGQVLKRLSSLPLKQDRVEMAFGVGGMLVLAPLSSGVQIWESKTSQLLATLVDEERWYEESPKSLAFSPDGTLLAVGHADGADVLIWRADDGQFLRVMKAHPLSQRIRGVAFTPDGKWLIGSEWSTDPEEESKSVWDVRTGQRIDSLPHMGWLPAVSPDGQFVAFADNQFLSLWNLREKRLCWQVDYDDSDRLLFSPSGQQLLSFHSRGAIWLDVRNGEVIYRLLPEKHGNIC